MQVAPTRPHPTKGRQVPGGKSVRAWRWTVVTGAALLVLLVCLALPTTPPHSRMPFR